MPEWWFLLLPVAAATGWLGAYRHYARKFQENHTDSLRQLYCRGLNYFLGEKTDKAIDTFAALLSSDLETIETHIALGNLYRRRGEIPRAIEIHEGLSHKFNLSAEQQKNVYFELGMDYFRLGLFDRAESLLSMLLDCERFEKPCLQQLLHIYQQEKEWRKAIVCTRRLGEKYKVPKNESVAQFLCELAESTLVADRKDESLQYLEEALIENPRCVRATLIIARLKMRDGDFETALNALRRVESQDHRYIPEILEPLRICSERLNKGIAEVMGYLGYLYDKYGFESVALLLADELKSERGVDRALEHLNRAMDRRPSIRTLNALVGLLLEGGTEAQRDTFIKLDRAVDRLAIGLTRYSCEKCGFGGTEIHWRCPSCQTWESIRPI